MAKIRTATAGAPPPEFTYLPLDARFAKFQTVAADNVIAVIGHLPDKSSTIDPFPTAELKLISDLLAPYITELFNRSLASGQVPKCFKHAYITPIVKKSGLDNADLCSYRPISNLPVLSKTLERLVAAQLLTYLNIHQLLSSVQSGFRPGYSTETAVLKVLSDILAAVDRGDIAVLVLLNLSAALIQLTTTNVCVERLRSLIKLTVGSSLICQDVPNQFVVVMSYPRLLQ